MIDAKRREALSRLLAKCRVRVSHLELVDHALTHTSYAHEQKGGYADSNEKLEYLGDAVLGLVVSEYIYRRFPDLDEGGLSKIKGHVVSEAVLSKVARDLGLGQFLRLGKGEEHSGGSKRDSTLADAFEALVGAFYLDGDLHSVRSFILRQLEPVITESKSDTIAKDYKSALQEFVQKKFRSSPRYEVLRELGPQHRKEFEVQVKVNGEVYGVGRGKNKKQAQQAAAEQAWARLSSAPGGHEPLSVERPSLGGEWSDRPVRRSGRSRRRRRGGPLRTKSLESGLREVHEDTS